MAAKTPNPEPKHISVLSLGAGVQSSCLALMIAKGEIKPKYPEMHAIFSDVGWEPPKVYEWLDQLEEHLPFPVHRVNRGHLRNDLLASARNKTRIGNPPLYSMSPEGKKGMLRRVCTYEYKILPIIKQIRTLLGYLPRKKVRKGDKVYQMMGISYDEMTRMNESRLQYIEHAFPLVDLKMTREDCKTWLADHGFLEPPRSACIGCPYRSTDEWLDMRKDPATWADAIEVDEAIRDGIKGTKDQLFLHRSAIPLKDVVFEELDDTHAISFLDECSGLCGN